MVHPASFSHIPAPRLHPKAESIRFALWSDMKNTLIQFAALTCLLTAWGCSEGLDEIKDAPIPEDQQAAADAVTDAGGDLSTDDKGHVVGVVFTAPELDADTLKQLEKLPSLKTIVLPQDATYPKEAMNALLKVLPDCQVTHMGALGN